MKKILFLLVLVCAASLIYAKPWKDTNGYTQYKFARSIANEADSEGNTAVAVEKYKEAAEIAQEQEQYCIEAWQYNNAGKALLDKYSEIKDVSLLDEAEELLKESISIANMYKCSDVLEKAKSNLKWCKRLLNARK